MHKDFGSIRVKLNEDTQSGMRVTPISPGSAPLIDAMTEPLVSAAAADKYTGWIGITLESGRAGDIVPIAPPYSGSVMVRVKIDNYDLHTGWWVRTDDDGYFTTDRGTGEILTGVVISPELHETAAPGKIVKAMIFTGRFIYDSNV